MMRERWERQSDYPSVPSSWAEHEVIALLDALDAAEAREAALREAAGEFHAAWFAVQKGLCDFELHNEAVERLERAEEGIRAALALLGEIGAKGMSTTADLFAQVEAAINRFERRDFDRFDEICMAEWWVGVVKRQQAALRELRGALDVAEAREATLREAAQRLKILNTPAFIGWEPSPERYQALENAFEALWAAAGLLGEAGKDD